MDSIINNLRAFGLSTDLKPVTLKHLQKVDKVLESLSGNIIEAIRQLKTDKISINRVAKESGIARQTFYNNPIITKYIESYIKTKVPINPFDQLEALREEIRRKDRQISDMVKRNATVSKFKVENEELTNRIASLQATIKSQEELLNKLRSGRRFGRIDNE